jgi:hypothetical protein
MIGMAWSVTKANFKLDDALNFPESFSLEWLGTDAYKDELFGLFNRP